MTRCRVNFFWDNHGCSTTLWIRHCVLPGGFSHLNVVHDGLWVREKPQPSDGLTVMERARLYIPMDNEMLFAPLDGTAWIPPGRISSVTKAEPV